MRTLALSDAAAFLKLHPEEVRRRARRGVIPGARVGRRWVFIEDDLTAYVRSLYGAQARSCLESGLHERSDTAWHYANAAKSGGWISPHRAASELGALLKQKIGARRKNFTTD